MDKKQLDSEINHMQNLKQKRRMTMIKNMIKTYSDYFFLTATGCFAAFLITFFFSNGNYYLSWLNNILFALGSASLIICLVLDINWKDKPKNKDYKDTWIYRGVVIFVTLGLIVNIIMMFMPINVSNTGQTKPENNTTYVLYSDNCKYCKAAEPGVKKAVKLYNSRSNKPVQFVDIDANTKLSNDLRDHIALKGSIVRYKDGKYTVAVYTEKTQDNQPVKVSASHVYSELVDIK